MEGLGGLTAPKGEVLGKYRLVERLAIGGMAEVYLAKHVLPAVQMHFAVKRILSQLAENQEMIQMLLDEAKIASYLDHPSIVRTYDVGEDDGEYFIAMEYVHGKDLLTVFETLEENGQVLPIEHALYIVDRIASALQYAHEMRDIDDNPLNIVHRDVSPHNVIVSFDGVVKLLDFGIAKAANRESRTAHGTLKGKIPYMSPEQAKAEEVDRRSDIYSLGIILWELTTGRHLFWTADPHYEILQRIVEQKVPPPSTLVPGYPAELEAIVTKALAPTREGRYQRAGELQEALRVFGRKHDHLSSEFCMSDFMRECFRDEFAALREASKTASTFISHLVATHSGSSSASLAAFDDAAITDEDAAVTADDLEPVHRAETNDYSADDSAEMTLQGVGAEHFSAEVEQAASRYAESNRKTDKEMPRIVPPPADSPRLARISRRRPVEVTEPPTAETDVEQPPEKKPPTPTGAAVEPGTDRVVTGLLALVIFVLGFGAGFTAALLMGAP